MKFLILFAVLLGPLMSFAQESLVIGAYDFQNLKQAGIINCLDCGNGRSWTPSNIGYLYVVARAMQKRMHQLGYSRVDDMKNNATAIANVRQAGLDAFESRVFFNRLVDGVREGEVRKEAEKVFDQLMGRSQNFPALLKKDPELTQQHPQGSPQPDLISNVEEETAVH